MKLWKIGAIAVSLLMLAVFFEAAKGQSVGVFVASGQQAVTATAAALPSQALTVLCVKGAPGNSLTVYIGGPAVTTSTGYPLAASESACFPIGNANKLYVVASNTGSTLAWFATNNAVQ